ncbi:transcriptional family amidohydrolase family [Fusarium pseudocircinatum]|uniref:Transcriptional family amidohydrolase family n=1 Tax=Fusarium pseudocircinatum TaxID=56676 RepID=A0A8H5KYH0_9HYPO|nr:transcriptional family amidohydrolase family [Fusarium pseudocircinatum]
MLHPTQRQLSVPAGTFDTHVHVFDPTIGQYAKSRAYTPADAPMEDLIRFSSTLNSSSNPLNLVLVQPSPYDTDNRVLLQSLHKLNSNFTILARGIAVVNVLQITQDELTQMHHAGVRGLRINLQSHGKCVALENLKQTLQVAADKIRNLPGWRLQIFAPASTWDDLYDFVLQLPVEIIADHVGGLLGSSKLADGDVEEDVSLSQAGIGSLLDLAKRRCIWIKISGLYRASARTESGYDDLEGILRRLFKEVPDRLIWASDWPHTGEGKARAKKDAAKRLAEVEQFRAIDNLGILQSLREWAGSDEAWRKMMVKNPRRLFTSSVYDLALKLVSCFDNYREHIISMFYLLDLYARAVAC